MDEQSNDATATPPPPSPAANESQDSKSRPDSKADDEFDQISEGSFRLEDDTNSRGTSGPMVTNESSHPPPDSPAANAEDSADKEDDGEVAGNSSREESSSGAAAFEEVDAEFEADKSAQLDESDALGEDRTQEFETAQDKEEDEADAPGDDSHAGGDETDNRGDDSHVGGDEDASAEKDKDEEQMDVDEGNDQEESGDVDMPSPSTETAIEKNAGGEDEVDKVAEGDKNDEGHDAEEEGEKEKDGQEDAEKENDAQDGQDEDVEQMETTPDMPASLEDDDDNVDGEGEGNVENVQEPEESDICLIPDDEKEVTDAEREKAILARENIEKEDELAEKEKEKEAEQNREKNAAAAAACETAAPSTSEDPSQSEDPAADDNLTETLEGGTEHVHKIIIASTVISSHTCIECDTEKPCGYRYKHAESGSYHYVCEQACIDKILSENPGKYFVRHKKFLVEEVAESTEQKCIQCKEQKMCKYFFKQDDDVFHICNDDCFNLLNVEEPDKFKLKRHSIRVRNIGATISAQKEKPSEESRIVARTSAEAEMARVDRAASLVRRCADCSQEVVPGPAILQWEGLDFCNEICLGKYQRTIGSHCKTCNGEVSYQSLGKYCVRFGFAVQQFCCATCLNEFKKGLKTCSCCQKDITNEGEGFLAPVGDKEQFKDFCSQACMRRYDIMCNPKKKLRNDQCAVCNNDKPVRVEMLLDEKEHHFCSNPCFSAFKFVSNIAADQCGMCSKYFERKANEAHTIYVDKRPKMFCCRVCLNVYIINNRKIVSCQWCKVKKYNFDMISKQVNNEEVLMCSLNCLTLHGVSVSASTRSVSKCDNCDASAQPQYHLTMSDASLRNFCTYQCVMQFQSQFGRAPLTLDTEAAQQQDQSQEGGVPFPTGLPKRVKLKQTNKQGPTVPVIANVASLAGNPQSPRDVMGGGRGRGRGQRGRPKGRASYMESRHSPPDDSSLQQFQMRNARVQLTDIAPSLQAINPKGQPIKKRSVAVNTADKDTETKTKIITVPPFPPFVRNVQTQCKPNTVDTGVNCIPTMADAEIQTDEDYSGKVLIPVPVPIYIPQPMYMYSAPFPVPVPIPLPIPVPIFIPTTRNSAQGIMKEIKKIQDKMPADPFEAELLMMAEMVAEEKRESDSDSEEEMKQEPVVSYTNNVGIEQNHSFGDDVLQMALKMATGDYEESADLESGLTASTITNPPPGLHHQDPNDLSHHQLLSFDSTRPTRGRKRGSMNTSPVTPRNTRTPVKRARRDTPVIQQATEPSPPPPAQPTEKPDANMCLKYTFGVNAWKQWVMTKNSDIEKSSIRRRPFKTELLQMTADELNYSLCLFVKEVRKPNGTEYAPDTIYYLVLGIQQYLYENGRIDNIFTDPYYERFTDCLDEVARKFSVLYNDSQYIVTRVEEEHLWECKQLGAHSPHVLLSTLMFFNTKHFNLTTVEEHCQLSFSHIMKHWKRSPATKTAASRNVLLRFYPPQAGLDANPRKKKVYEQQENEENPLRCPVRLYEFYLSKCPESVKTRNDVFYLQPERSCVPDSPVWYSTQALGQDSLQKMLHRVKMVKEINIALLTS